MGRHPGYTAMGRHPGYTAMGRHPGYTAMGCLPRSTTIWLWSCTNYSCGRTCSSGEGMSSLSDLKNPSFFLKEVVLYCRAHLCQRIAYWSMKGFLHRLCFTRATALGI